MEPIEKIKVTLVVGAPGSGKGTLCREYAEKNNYLHVSTGDLCRDLMKMDTELGKKIAVHINDGKFVPDNLMFESILTFTCPFLINDLLSSLGKVK